jgi:hypothetical protein
MYFPILIYVMIYLINGGKYDEENVKDPTPSSLEV